MMINIWLPTEKVEKLLKLCKETLSQGKVTLRELASTIGKLYSTQPAMAMAPLQVRALQQDLIRAQQKQMNYSQVIPLSLKAKIELQWWLNNLELSKGCPIRLGNPDMIIYSDAASHQGWGAHLEGGPATGGSWTKEEKEEKHINELELMAAEIALKTFLKGRKPKLVHLFIDNMTALHYLIRKGGTKSPQLTEISKRIWNFLTLQGITLTASWIPSKENVIADWKSRQKPNSSEWNLNQRIFQGIITFCGKPENNLKKNEKITVVHVSESRPRMCSNKRTVPKLGKFSSPVPSILSDRENIKNPKDSINTQSHFDSPTLARPIMVPNLVGDVHSSSDSTAPKPKLIEKQQRGTSSSHQKQNSKSSGISCVRKQLKDKGISERASEIMLQARRNSTTQAYSTPWIKWVLWCSQRQVDPTDAPENLILDFLTDLYHRGLEYRTINVYRSALSAYHKHIQGTPVGQLKEVCTLMSGIDNLRPPTPKYTVIWEVDTALNCLKNLGGDDDKLSDKDLFLKTVMILALAKMKRCSDLHILDTRYMALGEDKVVFKLAEKTKNFKKKGAIPPPIPRIPSNWGQPMSG